MPTHCFMRRNRAQGFALILDVDTFADTPATEPDAEQHELAGRMLRRQPMAGVRRAPGIGVADAWAALEQLSTGALMRTSDRSEIAVAVAMVLAAWTVIPLTDDRSLLVLSSC